MKKQNIKFTLITSFIVTSYISFTLVMVNAGFTNSFAFLWLRSWSIAWLLAAPSLFFIAPLVRNKFKS